VLILYALTGLKIKINAKTTDAGEPPPTSKKDI
jgi:hypothetical protein